MASRQFMDGDSRRSLPSIACCFAMRFAMGFAMGFATVTLVVSSSDDPVLASPLEAAPVRDLSSRIFLPFAERYSPPSFIEQDQTGGELDDAELVGSRAFIGVGPRVVEFDLSRPHTPRLIARSSIFDGVVGDLEYVAGTLWAAVLPDRLRWTLALAPDCARSPTSICRHGCSRVIAIGSTWRPRPHFRTS